ncbi:cation:proton antiporter [Methanomicrobiaceae archaeon CYW5]|uniref:monovalent cation/H(+) antiporter subunit G n=1 Tax=Methanovulcanius yangii TaxID=1789227 RepID=UPI0029CA265C|nr:monovalent cation/H(+) antiporter subunit G [Methanovulcanius yangii]MBT8507753.1 cation:proton antiporter [Methanovulcanius yangii]
MDGGLITTVCIGIGLLASTLGVVGILRFPDVYTRLHAETKLTTFGSIFLCLAIIVHVLSKYLAGGDGQYVVLGVHTLVALAALAFTNAIGAHAISRAAHRAGIKPEGVIDRLSEVKQK